MHNLHSSNGQGTLDLELIHDRLRSKFANPVALGALQFRENDNQGSAAISTNRLVRLFTQRANLDYGIVCEGMCSLH